MFFQRKNNRAGAFLLEALIAVSILSVSLVMVIRAHVAALRAQTFARDHALAALLLENEMIKVIQKGTLERGRNTRKNLSAPYERFTFSLKTVPVLGDAASDALNEAQLSLSWMDGKKERRLSVATFVLNSP